VKEQIIDMSLNASGVRDTARVLRISTDTVLRELRKKEAALESVNTTFLRTHNPDDIAVAEGVSELWISSQTDTPNSYRLINSPMTKSWVVSLSCCDG
jgi:hypothetical protein